jgi:hypothetical protein
MFIWRRAGLLVASQWNFVFVLVNRDEISLPLQLSLDLYLAL